jgi:hypothetical protein
MRRCKGDPFYSIIVARRKRRQTGGGLYNPPIGPVRVPASRPSGESWLAARQKRLLTNTTLAGFARPESDGERSKFAVLTVTKFEPDRRVVSTAPSRRRRAAGGMIFFATLWQPDLLRFRNCRFGARNGSGGGS